MAFSPLGQTLYSLASAGTITTYRVDGGSLLQIGAVTGFAGFKRTLHRLDAREVREFKPAPSLMGRSASGRTVPAKIQRPRAGISGEPSGLSRGATLHGALLPGRLPAAPTTNLSHTEAPWNSQTAPIASQCLIDRRRRKEHPRTAARRLPHEEAVDRRPRLPHGRTRGRVLQRRRSGSCSSRAEPPPTSNEHATFSPARPRGRSRFTPREAPAGENRAPSRRPRREDSTMSQGDRSDALVFFGATGDLAHKMIFPALQALVKAGRAHRRAESGRGHAPLRAAAWRRDGR